MLTHFTFRLPNVGPVRSGRDWVRQPNTSCSGHTWLGPFLLKCSVPSPATMDERRASSLLFGALPADLLHRILKYCHSMADFSAVIRTSKRIYGVYKDHPSSILRSVACNHLDMPDKIFPFAFGVALYYERERVFGSPLKDWLGEDDLSASHLNPSRFYKMVSNHDVVVALEKKFSRR